LVYVDRDRKYFPQAIDACKPEWIAAGNSVWNTDVNLGGEIDLPINYSLVAVVVDIDGVASVTFKQWLKNGCPNEKFPGITKDDLPAGIEEAGSITISKIS